MSSIVRDHSDHVQLFRDSLGVKGEYRRTLKKAVKTVLGEEFANDRNFLNSLLDNPAILGSLEKYCLYDKDVFVTFIILGKNLWRRIQSLLRPCYRHFTAGLSLILTRNSFTSVYR